MNTIKVAIATVDRKGLRDHVSTTFARTPTFTILVITDKKVKDVEIIVNPAVSKSHCRGPLAVQTLVGQDIKTVVASEFGRSVSAMLDAYGIRRLMVKPKTSVIEVIGKLGFTSS
jgi:predicted Fe-Mo cluster-binding NifX family protein